MRSINGYHFTKIKTTEIKMAKTKYYKKVVEYNWNDYLNKEFGIREVDCLKVLFFPLNNLLSGFLITCLYPLYVYLVLYNYFRDRKVYWVEVKKK